MIIDRDDTDDLLARRQRGQRLRPEDRHCQMPGSFMIGGNGTTRQLSTLFTAHYQGLGTLPAVTNKALALMVHSSRKCRRQQLCGLYIDLIQLAYLIH